MSVCVSAASPVASRKSSPPVGGDCGSTRSPKSGGRRPGRLRLPQLGSRHRLCDSKENLESGRESSTEREPGATDGGEAPGPDCDSAAADGLRHENGQSDGPVDDSADLEISYRQRDDICLDPIYNLYAISVSVGVVLKMASICIYLSCESDSCFLLLPLPCVILCLVHPAVSLWNSGRRPLCDVCQKPE